MQYRLAIHLNLRFFWRTSGLFAWCDSRLTDHGGFQGEVGLGQLLETG
jgi:hypothetical protein